MINRINLTIDENLLKQLDEQANKMHISRSAYISVAISQKIQSDETLKALPELIKLAQKGLEGELKD